MTIDDKTLTQAINDSPLKDEDKKHWIALLPKLNEDHRERLYELLTTKTKVAGAIKGIQNALDIIAEAESEAEEEVKQEEKGDGKSEDADNDEEDASEEPKETGPTPEELQASKAAEEQKLAQLRAEIGSISQAAHGALPPSYN